MSYLAKATAAGTWSNSIHRACASAGLIPSAAAISAHESPASGPSSPRLSRSGRIRGLRPDETRAFIEHAFRDGTVPVTGTAITKILPPVSRSTAGGGHSEKKQHVLSRLAAFSSGSSASAREDLQSDAAGHSSANPVDRVLALDGGGIKGIFAASLLADFECNKFLPVSTAILLYV